MRQLSAGAMPSIRLTLLLFFLWLTCNNALYTTGGPGTGLQFDGTDDWMACTMDMNLDEFTVEAWFNVENIEVTAYGVTLFNIIADIGQDYLMIPMYNQYLYVLNATQPVLGPLPVVGVGNDPGALMFHLSFSLELLDPTTHLRKVDLCINQNICISSVSPFYLPSGGKLILGMRFETLWNGVVRTDAMVGLVDELRLWSRILNSTELQMYGSTIIPDPSNVPDLSGYWSFDDADDGTGLLVGQGTAASPLCYLGNGDTDQFPEYAASFFPVVGSYLLTDGLEATDIDVWLHGGTLPSGVFFRILNVSHPDSGFFCNCRWRQYNFKLSYGP
eukprot:Rmarinus@m.28173